MPNRRQPRADGNAASTSWHAPLAGFLFACLLAGCAMGPARIPQPLRAPAPAPATTAETLEETGGTPGRPTRPQVESGPATDVPTAARRIEAGPQVPAIPNTQPVSLVLDGVPLASFINVVFGTELGFAIEIEQAVRERQELVTLRVASAQRPRALYLTAVEVLRNYGVSVTETNGLLRFSVASAAEQPPVLVTARSLPDIPAGQRTVFAAVPLDASTPGRVAAQVRSMFPNNQVTLLEQVETNAILISGTGDNVRTAAEAVQALDRTSLRDKRSIRINPMYLAAEQLSTEIGRMLAAQGYPVTAGPGQGGVVTLVPVTSANAVMIFSESEAALAAATEWARQLDQPGDAGGAGGVYLYAARHTSVESLRPVLEAMVGGAPGGVAATTQSTERAQTPAQQPSVAQENREGGTRRTSRSSNGAGAISGEGGQIAMDTVRNVIVFQGDAQRWRAIQGVLARLDQPARQVVIEVTVAEVTLTDEFSHGVEWALQQVSVQGMAGPLTALGGNTPNASGLIWRGLSRSGQTRAVLNLFARDSRVRILSTPRLMVKSGESASIDVGTEVPIITSQATAPDLGGITPSVLQSIQYRKTGVLLELEALVHSGQRVDLNVSQEVSEAALTDTSDISSPSIFSRKLQTSLSLSDGESMLLGGLISSTATDSKTKVPLLGDIPGLGRLFQNRSLDGTRTELLMLITPYVIEDAVQAREITEAVQARFIDIQPE
ncbi:secretin N-terminal domain-containing protein [Luteimonas sp. 100069]|uniref:type II secretion system protein GspD n=1 Tax=Luteimonas sp. 100069 TaxID=2006109 RepID=UPI00131533F4|nr:secretin N-terminal domain-containing protein [Luteimonas sp. 100069]